MLKPHSLLFHNSQREAEDVLPRIVLLLNIPYLTLLLKHLLILLQATNIQTYQFYNKNSQCKFYAKNSKNITHYHFQADCRL